MTAFGSNCAASLPASGGPAVSITGAVFRYGARTVLECSNLDIPAGAVTALIGPNGAGKSTLLNGIAGLLSPAPGRITLGLEAGRPCCCSYVLQDTKINQSLPVTVREVVTMGRYAGKGFLRPLSRRDRGLVDEAMERTGVTHLARRHLSRLSGGELHRVLLAQGLVQDHEILLLDEPATGLDMVSVQAIRNTVREENARGCTVILTTHDLAEAWDADYVVLLAGRVVAGGPPGEVLAASNLAEAYGAGLLSVEGSHLFLDDPHHREADPHHSHDRLIHAEHDPTGLHPPG